LLIPFIHFSILYGRTGSNKYKRQTRFENAE
jgi:hypothetical protein